MVKLERRDGLLYSTWEGELDGLGERVFAAVSFGDEVRFCADAPKVSGFVPSGVPVRLRFGKPGASLQRAGNLPSLPADGEEVTTTDVLVALSEFVGGLTVRDLADYVVRADSIRRAALV